MESEGAEAVMPDLVDFFLYGFRNSTFKAEKLGFKRMLIPQNNLKGFDTSRLAIELVSVRKVEEAFRQLFG